VLFQDEGPGLGVLGDGVGHVARDAEARPPVGQRDHVLAIDALHHLAAAIVVGEGDDDVGVGVDDRGGREESVEQRLDGRPGPAGLLERLAQVVHHLLVAHVLAFEEGADVVHPHAGKVLALDRLEVRAAALDPQHLDRSPPVIALGDFDGRVAAAPDHERRLGADQPGGVDEKVQVAEPGSFRIVPPRMHRASRYHERSRGWQRHTGRALLGSDPKAPYQPARCIPRRPHRGRASTSSGSFLGVVNALRSGAVYR
jgi:hypothetical protein